MIKPFKRILVPVDFGDATQPAIDLALLVARRFEAEIVLMHAFDVTPLFAATPFAAPVEIEPLIDAAEKVLRDLVATTRAEWPRTTGVLRRGAPADAVLEAAQGHDADLVVIGTHGRQGIARAILGSVAEGIVRRSTIPVLTVHPSRGAKAA